MGKGTSRPPGYSRKIRASSASDQPADDGMLSNSVDFDFRIAGDGTWYYKGSPIARKALVRLFSTVLRHEDDGAYWLVTPVERVRIEVEDAPFTAVEMAASGTGRDQVLNFRTNVDTWVEAGPDHPIRVQHAPDSDEPRPYILVRDRLEALIVRSVYYHLVELGVEDEQDGRTGIGVWSKGSFFRLGSPD
jgi:uncharacterized protein